MATVNISSATQLVQYPIHGSSQASSTTSDTGRVEAVVERSLTTSIGKMQATSSFVSTERRLPIPASLSSIVTGRIRYSSLDPVENAVESKQMASQPPLPSCYYRIDAKEIISANNENCITPLPKQTDLMTQLKLLVEQKKASLPAIVDLMKRVIDKLNSYNAKEASTFILSTIAENPEFLASQIYGILTHPVCYDIRGNELPFVFYSSIFLDGLKLCEELMHRLDSASLKKIIRLDACYTGTCQLMRQHTPALREKYDNLSLHNPFNLPTLSEALPTISNPLLSIILSYVDSDILLSGSKSMLATLLHKSLNLPRLSEALPIISSSADSDSIILSNDLFAFLADIIFKDPPCMLTGWSEPEPEDGLPLIYYLFGGQKFSEENERRGLEPQVFAQLLTVTNTSGDMIINCLMRGAFTYEKLSIFDDLKNALTVAQLLRVFQKKNKFGMSAIHCLRFSPFSRLTECVSFLTSYMKYITEHIDSNYPEVLAFLTTENCRGTTILTHILKIFISANESRFWILEILSKCRPEHRKWIYQKIPNDYFAMIVAKEPATLSILAELNCSQLAKILKIKNKFNGKTIMHLFNFTELKPLLIKFVEEQKLNKLIKILKIKCIEDQAAFLRFTKEEILSLLDDAQKLFSDEQYQEIKRRLALLYEETGCCVIS